MKLASVVASIFVIGSHAEHENPKQYPVTKVTKLLQDMKSQLEKEAEADEEVDEKMKCWCNENQKTKTQLATDSQDEVKRLESTISSSRLESVRLSAEITNTEVELGKAETSLSSAETQHKKQKEAHEKEVAELKDNIKSLNKVHEHLKSKLGGSFLAGKTVVDEARDLAQKIQSKYSKKLIGVITPHQKNLFLLSTKQDQDPGAVGEITNIIGTMKDSLSSDLNTRQEDHTKSVESFAGLEAAKKQEILATKGSLTSKESQKAAADEKNAQSKEEVANTNKMIEDTEAFLSDLKSRCSEHDKEFSKRVSTRNQETSGIAKAIAVLSEDSARDTFAKTFNKGAMLLQLGSSEGSDADEADADDVAESLQAAGKKFKDTRLMMLAASARLGSFEKVNEEIDKLIEHLKSEKAQEVTQKANCETQLKSNSEDNDNYTREKSSADALHASLEGEIKEISKTVKGLSKQVEGLKDELTKADKNRKVSKAEFEETLKDQQETQRLLAKAIAVLKQTEASKKSALALGVLKSIVQKGSAKQDAAAEPQGFTSYAGGEYGSVVTLLEMISSDAQELEAAAKRAEAGAEEDYALFKKDTTKSLETTEETIVNQNEDKAKAEKAMVTAKDNALSAFRLIETLSEQKKLLKDECDPLIKDFDVRQAGLTQEVEALTQTKAILAKAAA
eukprot:TRINITY_DN90_c0_g2_i2.p1 TRINITY_DN90_c0_g2~~TRINITY_DN90_c0_g2_i2.p1  ORF type:complete len:677 (+),score=226.92 TRINITY_DN90_c0_g2_i2:86-2116(+)